LVAGGAGFIGSHVCEQLLSQNCFVYCLDNFSTGRRENISRLSQNDNFQVLDKDLNEVKKISLPKEPDYIFHLAGVEAYLNGVDFDLETLLVNSFGTQNLLNLAQETKAKFLLGSSIDVHSGFLSDTSLKTYFGKKRQSEARGVFNEAKRFSEALTVEYAQKHKLDARLVRLGFLYGPRMNLASGSILATLINQTVNKETLTIPGDGRTKVHPTFISDIVYGVVKAMFSQSSQAKIYTLINPEPVALLQFAQTLRELVGKKLEIDFVAAQEGIDIAFDFQDEITKSQEELGWYPKINYKSGLGETLNWFKKQKVGKVGKEEKDEKKQITAKTPVPVNAGLKEKKPASAPPEKTTSSIIPKFPLKKVKQTQSSILSFLKSHVGRAQQSTMPEGGQATSNQQPAKKPALNFRTFFLGLSISLILLLFILSPFLLFTFFSFKGARNLEKIKTSVSQKDWLSIKPQANSAKNSFANAQKTLKIIDSIFGPLGFSNKLQPAANLLSAGENISQSIVYATNAGTYAQELSQIILGQKVGDARSLISQIKIELTKTNELLGFAQTQLQTEEALSSFNLEKKLKDLSNQIPQWRQNLYLAQTALDILPEALSLEGKKTYLLLLQNNHELRPTGGFIGSYGLLTFEKGKLLDIKIEDVYTADGQLKGHVEPPEEIKNYLGEETWFLRDSNFSPDFPTSASRAGWFLEKEIARQTDGVIGLNLYFIQKILKVTGPILLPDYDEQVTSDNLFERCQYHAEVNFFPGSTQKKDFLSSLTTQLFEKLKELPLHQFPQTSLALLESLEQKAILVWLEDGRAKKTLSQLGWDGALRTPPVGLPKFSQEAFTDYLMLAEANFAVNKANYFVKRDASQEITINGKTGEITAKTTLNLKNESPSNAWPAGLYKNYVRLLLPTASQLISVKTAASLDQPVTKTIPKKDIKQTTEAGKKSIGFLVEVPVGEEKKIEVNYKLGQKLPLDKKEITYILLWQKQPGIADDPIKLVINHPVFLQPTKLSQEAVMKEGSLTFGSDLGKDRIFAVAFGR